MGARLVLRHPLSSDLTPLARRTADYERRVPDADEQACALFAVRGYSEVRP